MTWTFASNENQCSGSLSTIAFTATCDGADGLPDPLPNSFDGDFAGAKTMTGTSVFGDLGGTWHFSGVGQSGGCDATLNGNTVSINCPDADEFTGTVQATFCDGVVTGTTSAGVQFSGRRR